MKNAAPSHFEPLLESIENRSATIGIVGLGYVGLPLLLRFCDVGFTVVGFDVDATKIDMLRSAVPSSSTSPRRAWPLPGPGFQ